MADVPLNGLSLPVGANPEMDQVVGWDELGRKMYQSPFGVQYYIETQQQGPRGSVIKGAYNALLQDPIGAVGGLATNALNGLWSGVETPLNALRGQPVTYGDALNSAGLVSVGGAGVAAPAGALRSGAMRTLGIEDALRAKFPDVKLTITESPSGLTLNRIEVPKGSRNSGVGSAVMAEVTKMADAAGVPVRLSPSGDFGGSVPRLRDFYKRFGFVENKGRARDFDTTESMYRQPVGPRTTPAQQSANQVLDMLKTGRAAQVTDEMMAAADPQTLWAGYDLPMDAASRTQRAGEMGFDTGTPLYHGTKSDFPAFDRAQIMPNGARGDGFYMTDSPSSSSAYSGGEGVMRMDVRNGDAPNVLPLWAGGNILDENAILSRSQISAINPDLGPKHFDRAYPAKGGNVMQETSYKPNEANAAIRGAGYTGRRGGGIVDGTDTVVFDPTKIRSQFARFDPRLSHLKNLSASIMAGGIGMANLLDYLNNPEGQN